MLSLEGRRLMETTMVDTKYEKDHYMEEESSICGILEGQQVGGYHLL